MKQILIFFLLFICWSCQNTAPKPASPEAEPNSMTPAPKVLTAITADGTILLEDGSSIPVPHYGDQGYLILYLVRHCEKDTLPPGNPALSAAGLARAERLGKIFDNALLDKVTSTNTKRTMDTALAVKRQAGDPIMETFPPAAQNDWLLETIATGGGKKVFYAGHQNTVPDMLNVLTQTNTFKEIPSDEFGLFYIAITKGTGQTEVLTLKY